MKKTPKKLAFRSETIRLLDDKNLSQAVGGSVITSGTSVRGDSGTSILSSGTSVISSGTSVISHH